MNYLFRFWLTCSYLILSPIGLVYSQTLHFIVFADTDDAKIGTANLKTYTYLTQNLAPAIAKQGRLTLSLSGFYGADCRLANLKSVLAPLKPGPDDVIFFYFAGHGWNNRQNEYTSLIFGNANTDRTTLETNSVNLLDLYRQFMTYKARMTVVIGEACNKERSDSPVLLTSTRPVDIMAPKPYDPQRFQQLFRTTRGGLLMGSSKRGQFSHTDPKGGWMGVAWQNAIQEELSDDRKAHIGSASWPVLIKRVVNETQSLSRQNGQPQEPMVINELVPCPTCMSQPPTIAVVSQSLKSQSPNTPCPPIYSYVNETALAGIREDLPLLKEMYEKIDSDNSEQYARRFSLFYQNQQAFYNKLGEMIFYKASQMPTHCRPAFEKSVGWVKESTEEINERYALVKKFSAKPLQLVAQARSELPSVIQRLEDILEQLDK